jgi:hypothetical protein
MEPKIKVYRYAALSYTSLPVHRKHIIQYTVLLRIEDAYFAHPPLSPLKIWVRLIFEVMRNNTVPYEYVRLDVLTAGTPCSVSKRPAT